MGQVHLGPSYWNADTTLKSRLGCTSLSDGEWGELKDAIALPTGLSITSNVGSIDVPDIIITPTGQEITASQGEAFNPVSIDDTLSITSSIGS